MVYSKILGTGSYLPERIMTNHDLEKIVETSHDWIVDRTGIHERRIAADHENAMTMAHAAVLKALEAAQIDASEIDLIIVTTSTPSHVFPSTACFLQAAMGLKTIPAFDLNSTACAGFIYGFSIADHFIRLGTAKHVLLIGSEVMSRILDWKDRSTCVLFGDGAGAIVLSKSDEPGVYSTHLHADGRYQDVLFLPLALASTPTIETLQMTGNQLFKLAVKILGDLFDETLAAHGFNKSDIDWLVPHQANLRIIQAMAKKLNLSMERVTLALDKQGNTSSASIPLALDKAIRNNQIKRGDLLLLEGFGGGLAWGSALVRY